MSCESLDEMGGLRRMASTMSSESLDDMASESPMAMGDMKVVRLLKKIDSVASTDCSPNLDQISEEEQSSDSGNERPSWRDTTILFAVPSEDALHQDAMNLLEGAGLDAKCSENLHVKLVPLPIADIPMYVIDGSVDFGIAASHVLEETLLKADLPQSEGDAAPSFKVVLEPGFGHGKLCLQAPKEMCANGPASFANQRVATPFPALTKKYFGTLSADKSRVRATTGSADVALGLGLAEAIVEFVAPGKKPRPGLDIVSEVLSTKAVIMQHMPAEQQIPTTPKEELSNLIIDRINGYLTSKKWLMIQYLCDDASLKACCALTPGKRSPTVKHLMEKGWHSVEALVEKSKLHTVMDELDKLVTQDIFCTALSNTRM